jgi:ATP/maltotriose-dependent transcriptional regulator MalT
MALEAERVAHASGADLQIAIAGGWMTRLHLARGDLAEAVAFEQERAASAENDADAARVVDRLTSARLLHAQGRRREALPLLEELGEAAAEAGRTGDLIEILVLRAVALWARNEKERAVSTLARGLALAEPEGYVRTFVDEGPAMGDLLSATLEARQRSHLDAAEHVSACYLAKLLEAAARDAAAPGADERLPEPLSERELEVLALIAAGESNGEICAQALRLNEHRQDPHQPPLPQAGGAQPHPGGGPRQRDEPLLVRCYRLEHLLAGKQSEEVFEVEGGDLGLEALLECVMN